jgi:hypothetical protein
VAAHGALPPAWIEAVECHQERIATHIRADAADIANAGNPISVWVSVRKQPLGVLMSADLGAHTAEFSTVWRVHFVFSWYGHRRYSTATERFTRRNEDTK